MKKVASLFLLLAGCYGPDPARVIAEDPAPAPEVDAGAADVVPDVALYTPDVDSAPVDPEPEDPPVEDAGVVQPKDSGAVDAATPAPCVESIKLPTASTPVWVRYAGGVSASYYCPGGTVDFNSCKYVLQKVGWRLVGDTIYPVYPETQCRVTVPEKCLPCTGGVTQW